MTTTFYEHWRDVSASKPRKRPMQLIAGCRRLRRVGLILAPSWVAACAMAGSEPAALGRPPVVEYSQEFQARAAEELALLPDQSAIAEMLSDHAVVRDQARACRRWSAEFLSV